MARFVLLAAAFALPLSGCYTVQGPPQIINADGVLPGQLASGTREGVLQLGFRRAADRAFDENATQADIDLFLQSGFTLNYARCNDYFWHGGHGQTRARALRDTIAPIVTLLTGVIALHNFKDPGHEQNLLQALTLGSAFTTAGFDIYDRHFLFGAENIDSVRELTLTALSTHRKAVNDVRPATVQQAVTHLIDNEAICTPSHILALAREAIANGNLKPSSGAGGGGKTDQAGADANGNESGDDRTSDDPDDHIKVSVVPQ